MRSGAVSGVRAGRCWVDGRMVKMAGAEERKRGMGKDRKSWRKRERMLDIGDRGRERSGAFPRTVGPRCGVGCPALISARSGSGFSSNPVLPKPQREVGG